MVLASDPPVDLRPTKRGFATQATGWDLIDGDRSTAWIGDAPLLTDDYAPVDQLLTPHPSS